MLLPVWRRTFGFFRTHTFSGKAPPPQATIGFDRFSEPRSSPMLDFGFGSSTSDFKSVSTAAAVRLLLWRITAHWSTRFFPYCSVRSHRGYALLESTSLGYGKFTKSQNLRSILTVSIPCDRELNLISHFPTNLPSF